MPNGCPLHRSRPWTRHTPTQTKPFANEMSARRTTGDHSHALPTVVLHSPTMATSHRPQCGPSLLGRRLSRVIPQNALAPTRNLTQSTYHNRTATLQEATGSRVGCLHPTHPVQHPHYTFQADLQTPDLLVYPSTSGVGPPACLVTEVLVIIMAALATLGPARLIYPLLEPTCGPFRKPSQRANPDPQYLYHVGSQLAY